MAFRRTAVALAALALLAIPASAQAAGAPTVAESLAIADAYWGDHPCAGRVHAISDPTLWAQDRQGIASGMVLIDGVWRVERCEIAYATELDADPAVRCHTIVHEVGHLKHGAGHVGLMDRHYLSTHAAPGCFAGEPTQRQDLISDIREQLPKGLRWRIACTPNSSRMRCRATSRAARYARLFTAEITDNAVDVAFLRLARR